MALNRKTFKKVAAAADAALVPSENFNTVLYTGTGATQRIGGYINRGAVFNGSSSKIVLPSGEPFGDTNTIKSISTFVKARTTSSRMHFFSVSGNDAFDWFSARYDGTANNISVYRRKDSSSHVAFAEASVTTDTDWHHIVVQLGTSGVEIYLDGVSQTVTNSNSGDGSNTSWISFPNYAGTIVTQMGKSREVTPQWSDGVQDQTRLFNRALTQGEITTLSNETHASTTKSTTDIFDDDSGIALYQLDGNANDTGGANGKFGAAAIFNGSSSKIETTLDRSSFTSLSYSCWIKTSSTSQQRVIDSTESTTQGHNRGLYTIFDGTRGIRYASIGNDLYDTGNLNNLLGEWIHVAVTDGGGDNVTIYVNGQSESITKTVNNASYDTPNSTSIGAGRKSTNVIGDYFNGTIDDVRIYSDVLTSTEVGYLYNNTTASIPSDFVAYYKFDGNALDETGDFDGTESNITYGFDGTATNVIYQEATHFSPDLVWIKNRDQTDGHRIQDSIRGTKYLESNSTAAQVEAGSAGLTTFDSNGFTIGTGASYNTNNEDYAAWCWNAGETIVTDTTTGDLDADIRANTSAGFSIVEFSNTTANNVTVPHGLDSPPKMIILKSYSHTGSWSVYAEPNGATKRMRLHTAENAQTNSNFMNDTAPTADVFTIGHTDYWGSNRDFIAYCFHDVDNYQKIGSYTGAGSSGKTITTGFQPAFVIIKRTDDPNNASSWAMYDSERGGTKYLLPNSSAAEGSNSTRDISFTSNGFTIPTTSTSGLINESGDTYIYLAIAADPDTTRPVVAKSFDVTTYTGNGGTQDIETRFKPDLVWIKAREASGNTVSYTHLTLPTKRIV